MYQSVKVEEGGAAASANQPAVFRLQVEQWRLTAYLSFWGMCLFAFICTTFTVAPLLGPCPLTPGAEPTYGLHCSVLMETFGFNNICVNWDYSPAREATALVYPLFEYSLIAYVVLDHIRSRVEYKNGKFGDQLFRITNVLFWVKIVLIAWFRMIFVCSVFQEPIPFFGGELTAVVAHTLGFFGMQFALILIAFENVCQVIYRGNGEWGMSPELTRKLSVVYLVVLTCITFLKISWASSIFIYGTPWIEAPWPHIFDRTWMVLAAVMPVFFSWHQMKHEPDLVVTLVTEEQE